MKSRPVNFRNSQCMQKSLENIHFKSDGKLVSSDTKSEVNLRICLLNAASKFGSCQLANQCKSGHSHLISFPINESCNFAWIESLCILQDKIYYETGYLLWEPKREESPIKKDMNYQVLISSPFPQDIIPLITDYSMMPSPLFCANKYPSIKLFMSQKMAAEISPQMAGKYNFIIDLIGFSPPKIGSRVIGLKLIARKYMGVTVHSTILP